MSSSEIFDSYLQGAYAQGELAKMQALKKTAADNQLGVGSTQDEVAIAHPGGGVTTEQVVGGDQYNLNTAPIAGAEHAKTETITEVQKVMLDVAKKEKTSDSGEPSAHEAGIRGFSKNITSQDKTVQAKVELLNRLITIADEFEKKNLQAEAAQIDTIIAEEVGAKVIETK